MVAKHSITKVARTAVAEDKKARTTVVKDAAAKAKKGGSITLDSFVNFAQKMGVGADSPLSTASYGYNPISRLRVILEWIYRGSWLGGVAVDVVANDMTRAGVDINSSLQPDQIAQIDEAATTLGIWSKICNVIKWSRLYGGSLGVLLVDGQSLSTPLRLETIGKGQFKGILVLDRWMVDPSLNDLVMDMGPELGLPKYYTITANAPALPNTKVHHSRCIRMEGIELPYWQKLQENLWGISILERLNDRMVAFDSATTGAAQLVYKAYIRTYKVKGLREVIAAGGDAMNGLLGYTELMRRFQGSEGITLIDGEDEMSVMQAPTFSGLSDALTQFGQQISGALQIPLVRLFGQSPSGFSSGDTDLRMYYDQIRQQQEATLKVPVTKIYRAIAQSEGIKVPDGFSIGFRSLWQLTDEEKAIIADRTADAVGKAHDAGFISDKVALQELRQSSKVTGIFTNITDKDVNDALDSPAPPPLASEAMGGGEEGVVKVGEEEEEAGETETQAKDRKRAKG